MFSRGTMSDDARHGSSFQVLARVGVKTLDREINTLTYLNNTGPHMTTIFTAYAYGSELRKPVSGAFPTIFLHHRWRV